MTANVGRDDGAAHEDAPAVDREAVVWVVAGVAWYVSAVRRLHMRGLEQSVAILARPEYRDRVGSDSLLVRAEMDRDRWEVVEDCLRAWRELESATKLAASPFPSRRVRALQKARVAWAIVYRPRALVYRQRARGSPFRLWSGPRDSAFPASELARVFEAWAARGAPLMSERPPTAWKRNLPSAAVACLAKYLDAERAGADPNPHANQAASFVVWLAPALGTVGDLLSPVSASNDHRLVLLKRESARQRVQAVLYRDGPRAAARALVERLTGASLR